MATAIYNLGQNIYNYLLSDKVLKEGQILEPLSSIIRLSMLHLKDEGTKLQIVNNSIKFDTPNFLQGPNRWINGDTRSDLHNLSNPLQISIEWYSPSQSEDLKFIYQQSLEGLNVLGKSYDIDNISSLIANTIQHYKILITTALKKTDEITNNSNKNKEDLTKSCISDNTEINKQYKELWNRMEINIIKKLLTIAIKKKEKGEMYDNYLTSIESILDDKDQHIRSIIYKNNTKIK